MAAPQFLGTVMGLFALMGLLSFIEVGVPLFARKKEQRGRIGANVGLTIITFLLNWFLNWGAAALALLLSIHPRRYFSMRALPPFAAAAVSVILLDLATYFAHLTMHKTSLLWRIHRVHHSDSFVDVTTAFRQHPGEGVWRFVWIISSIWIFGLSSSGVVVYRFLSAGNALLEHANIRVSCALDNWLSIFWTTPNMHKVHHSRSGVQTDSNYGNILSVFDRIFGTFTPTEQAFSVMYGLQDCTPEQGRSFPTLLKMPFANVD